MANSEVSLQVVIDGVEVKNGRSGITTRFDPTIHDVNEAMISGEQLSNLRYYTIAMPSEIPYGVLKLGNVLGFALFRLICCKSSISPRLKWGCLNSHV